MTAYAELHCLSNFSFGRGASSARELFQRALQLGYSALAITDECSLAGIVRAHEAARAVKLKLLVGTEIVLADGLKLVLLATDLGAYSDLCRLITRGRRAAKKGYYALARHDLDTLGSGVLCLWLTQPAATANEQYADGAWLRARFAERLWLAVELHRGADDAQRLQRLSALAKELTIPMVASGDVHMHTRRRRALQDVLTAIRLRTTVAQAGLALFPNGERHLRKREDLTELYPAALLAESLRIAERCNFSLDQLVYQYPHEVVPAGCSAHQHLCALTWAGAAERWPAGIAAALRGQIEHELALIAELAYEHYFLTVHDIVAWARAQGILCQGRGSAANSAVCFCLGITEVDPARGHLLFERFISRERKEPPDIDVDFEHERRESVFQYIYGKYGRERAALAATVICYRPKSALRDVGKALGLSLDQVDRIGKSLSWWDGLSAMDERLRERGFDPNAPLLRKSLRLVRELLDCPRHLSQHVGGFVIAEQPLHTLVPVENAAMAERTVIQWDKDDLDALGLLKVDCLALGMLSCLRRCLDMVERCHGRRYSLASIPAEDPHTYAMLSRADTVGVFQVESRAQMAMLPRLKPRNFYDLVIEVALVRPGPIQGKMVHPYLRRRNGTETVSYPSPDLKLVFERTLGVPIFQEQVMQLAVVAAGFTPGEADQLRRSMAAWKRHGGLEHFQQRIIGGMTERGYDAAFAAQVFEQIKGFGSYGFPESHAASFALLVYASAWLKCHYPAAFAAGLLNAQPLGFYSPDQILQDARRHGLQVRPSDVRYSAWDADLEDLAGAAQPAIRLGLREIRGMREEPAQRIVAARLAAPLRDLHDLAARAELDRYDLRLLAEAGALRGLAGHRHRAFWEAEAVAPQLPLFAGLRVAEAPVALRPPSSSENLHADYARLGYTLGKHPLALLRPQLKARRLKSVTEILALPPGSRARTIGLVSLRQRPGTAAGVTFLTIEDETGWLNVIVWKDLAARQRRVLLEAQLLGIRGVFEHAEGVSHFIAQELSDHADLLAGLDARSRDFH